jgi:hypothetical protein
MRERANADGSTAGKRVEKGRYEGTGGQGQATIGQIGRNSALFAIRFSFGPARVFSCSRPEFYPRQPIE